MHRLAARAKDQDGAISVMAAGLILAMLLSTALAVDVGRVASVSRDQQGMTDRFALDSVLQVSRSHKGLEGLYDDVKGAVIASMDRNPGSTSTAEQLDVVAIYLGTTQNGQFEAFCGEGKPDPDPEAPPPPPLCTDVADPDGSVRDSVNAVWVATESVVPFVFAIGAGTDDETGIVGQRVRKVSVAETLAVAGIMIGSRLASLDVSNLKEGLDALVCNERVARDPEDCEVELPFELDSSVASYEGLANFQVTFADLVDHLVLDVGSVGEVLRAEVAARDVLQATATILGTRGDTVEAGILNAIASEMSGSTVMTLGANDEDLPFLLDMATTNGQAVMRSQVNVLGIVTAVLQVANHNHFLAVPDLTATVPGLISATGDMTVVSAPAQAFGPARQTSDGWVTQARTAQVGLDLSATLEGSNLDGVVSTIVTELAGAADTLGLGLLSLGGTVSVSNLEMPVRVAIAEGRTQLTEIRCPQDGLPDVTELVDSGVVSVEVLEVDGGLVQLTIPLRLQVGILSVLSGTLVVTVQGTATPAQLGSERAGSSIEFTEGDYPRGSETVDGFTGLDGVEGGKLEVNTVVSYSGSSLIGQAVALVTNDIGVLITDGVRDEYLTVLEALTPTLELIGAQVGSADVWATSADCAYRRLAPISLD